MRLLPVALLLMPIAATAQDAERAAVDQCFAQAAQRLDDGSSDARTIASALLSTCSKQRRAVIAKLMNKPADHPQVADTFLQSREVSLDRATEVVLSERVQRRRP